MKLPSLDTAEGTVLLGAAALLVYVLYRASKLPAQVQQTLAAAGETVSNAVSSIIPHSSAENAANAMLDSDPLSPENVANALKNRPIDYGTGTNWDGSLGTDSRIGNSPQICSPDPILTNDQLIAEMGGDA